MEKCKYADKYQAIYPPRCGCRTCQEKWEKKLEAEKKEAGDPDFGDFSTMLAITSFYDTN